MPQTLALLQDALSGRALALFLGALLLWTVAVSGFAQPGGAATAPANVGIVVPSEADGVLSKAAALTETGQDAEALKALGALDEAKLSGATFKRYGDECDAILKPVREKCDEMRKAGQFAEAVKFVAAHDRSDLKSPLPKRYVTGLRQADGWVRVDWAAQLRDSKKYLEAIAVVQGMDPVANATSSARIHAANTLRASSTGWARDEWDAAAKQLADPATRDAGLDRLKAMVEKLRSLALSNGAELLAQAQYRVADGLLAAGRYEEALAAIHTAPLSPRKAGPVTGGPARSGTTSASKPPEGGTTNASRPTEAGTKSISLSPPGRGAGVRGDFPDRNGDEGYPTTATWSVLQDAAKFPERCALVWEQAEFAETRKLRDGARKTLDDTRKAFDEARANLDDAQKRLDVATAQKDPDLRASAESVRAAAETAFTAVESPHATAESTLAAAVERVRGDLDKARRLGAAPGGQAEAQARYELADTLLAAGRYDDAMAAVRVFSLSPSKVGGAVPADGVERGKGEGFPTTATWGVLQSAAAFPERCAKAWLDSESKELQQLCDKKGSEQLAYKKLLELRSKIAAWKVPEPEQVLKEREVAWARTVVGRLRDQRQFNEALDILAANKPKDTTGRAFDAPVVRDKEVTKDNASTLMAVWEWSRSADRYGLLFFAAANKMGEVPADSPLLQKEAFGWETVWMLIEAGHGEKADALIERMGGPSGGIESQYAAAYSLWSQRRFEEAIAVCDRVLNDPDARGSRGPEPPDMKLWIQFTKFRSLVALQRTDEARPLAKVILESWPKSHFTEPCRMWLERNPPKEGGEKAGAESKSDSPNRTDAPGQTNIGKETTK